MDSFKTKNPNIYDRAQLDYEGHTHILYVHRVRWSDFKDSLEYNRIFSYFDIIRSSDKTLIGRVTEYTTDERLISLFYRWYHRDHLKPLDFSATVYFSGPADSSEEEGTLTKSPYAIIPPDIFKEADGRIDDEIRMTVTNPEGFVNTQSYHVSKMNRSYIMPLTQFKRLVFMEDPDGDPEKLPKKRYIRQVGENLYLVMIKKDVYKSGMDELKKKGECPFKTFISEGDQIRVHIDPAPMRDGARCFDFAGNTLNHIDALKRVEAIRRAAQKDRESRI